MEVVFLGTGVGVPSLRRASPGLIVVAGEENLLFDSGPGTLRKMLEAGFTYQDIDRVFYTHFHVDHIADLAPLLFAAKYPLSLRKENLTIIGPTGFKEFHEQLVQLYGKQIVSEHYLLRVEEVDQAGIEGRGFRIVTGSVAHTEQSIGYRIEDAEGKILVYSGDSDYSTSLVQLCKNANLVILECSFPDKVQGHLSPSLAGRVATEANAERLALTHLYPICDEREILALCEREFSGEVLIAQDLMRVRV